MTPFAQQIVKEVLVDGNVHCKPLKYEMFYTSERDNLEFLARSIVTSHCFDVSLIDPLAWELNKPGALNTTGDFSFPPFPATWVELGDDEGWRIGWLSLDASAYEKLPLGLLRFHSETSAGDFHDPYLVIIFHRNPAKTWSVFAPSVTGGPGSSDQRLFAFSLSVPAEDALAVSAELGHLKRLFVVMNSPKIISRATEPPHRGLVRDLRRGGETGELQPWHTIKLQIEPDAVRESGEGGDGPIQGKRALHWCRRFVRVKRGRLEFVRAHLRGDPSVGIGRANYRVTPPPKAN